MKGSVADAEDRKYRRWYNSPAGKRQYLHKAYASGATTFDPNKYELATSTSPDLGRLKEKALSNIKAMFQKETPMNQDELAILTRIAVALEAMVQASAPATPNYQFPFEEYHNFDWSRINATVAASDEYGATIVSWNGHTWKRRSWPQKYGLVVGFTRADGLGEEGVNWLNLVSFKEMTAVEPLDSKVTQALAGQRKANGNGRKYQPAPASQPAPGTWEHVDAGGAKDNLRADLRAAIEGQGEQTKMGFVADKAAQTGLYTNTHHALQAINSWPGLPAGVPVAISKSVKVSTALAIFDWLVSRKAEEVQE